MDRRPRIALLGACLVELRGEPVAGRFALRRRCPAIAAPKVSPAFVDVAQGAPGTAGGYWRLLNPRGEAGLVPRPEGAPRE
jgi:hypothetical protein